MKTKPSVGGLPNDLGNREAMRHRKPQKPQKGQPISGESQVLHVGYWYVLHDLAGGFKPMENRCCLASSCQIKGEIHQSCLTHAETILRLAMSGYFSYPAVPYPSISYHTSGLRARALLVALPVFKPSKVAAKGQYRPSPQATHSGCTAVPMSIVSFAQPQSWWNVSWGVPKPSKKVR